VKACDGWVAIEEAAPAVRCYMEEQQPKRGALLALLLLATPLQA
jgi:hypothetical protein